MRSNRSARPTGATEYRVGLALAVIAWAIMGMQELFLFLRPTPYGGAYVQQWGWYLSRAMFYNLLGPGLIALPFLLRWLAGYRRPVEERVARRWHMVELVLLTLCVGLDHADNEVMRFLGTHLTFALLRTYERVGAWGSDMIHVFTTDRGGPGLPFLLLLGGMALVYLLGRRTILRGAGSADWPIGVALAAMGLPVAVPLVVYNLPGAHFPRGRVQPEVITLTLELARESRTGTAPSDLARRVADYRARWQSGSGDGMWTFTSDSVHPLVQVPRVALGPDSTRWNVIYLQLETFRGWDMGFLRPDRHPSPTPFLDHLAADTATAVWTRFLSFGPPTINGFMAGHCSIAPHSVQNISTTYTGTSFLCLPELLGRHGWHTAYFTGSDPDWDNQTIWLRRWYHEVTYYREADERDRDIFRLAAARIRELARGTRPFFATVVSISNHYPFRSREPALDLNAGRTPAEAVLNTIHYTDDVVREFVDSLAREPWFGRTLLVISGDHGYNLGEHDGTPGQQNGWRESVWVPFLIHGVHPRLPRGRHEELASHLDLAPTVAELLGIREPNPWLGRSLLTPPASQAWMGMLRGNVFFAETPDWSLVLDPGTGAPHLYRQPTDPLQRNDLAPDSADTAARLEAEVREQQGLWDYLVESDRVWSHHQTNPSAGGSP
jgi:arylsulfatase A-like enzyme